MPLASELASEDLIACSCLRVPHSRVRAATSVHSKADVIRVSAGRNAFITIRGAAAATFPTQYI